MNERHWQATDEIALLEDAAKETLASETPRPNTMRQLRHYIGRQLMAKGQPKNQRTQSLAALYEELTRRQMLYARSSAPAALNIQAESLLKTNDPLFSELLRSMGLGRTPKLSPEMTQRLRDDRSRQERAAKTAMRTTLDIRPTSLLQTDDPQMKRLKERLKQLKR